MVFMVKYVIKSRNMNAAVPLKLSSATTTQVDISISFIDGFRVLEKQLIVEN